MVFSVKNKKSDHHHSKFHIRISVCIKFQLKQTILILRTKFTQKEYLMIMKIEL